ncbi:histidine phosphatase family protein [Litchfieldella qijiaojingensis]|uniref:histidine phosphatase family protein n=1 Tax=Litchfieldella qijiaojingensis TaxID=980347 RepID=UPI001E35CD8A|nr:histidine phosphatase family protein [Halomonas qijiaojingensis]
MNLKNHYLLIRHGHSQANEAGIIVSAPRHGIAGYGLSSLGERQMHELLNDWQWPTPSILLHSDYRRTTQTAECIARHFKLIMQSEKGLRERFFGELDGQPDRRYHDVWALDAQDPDHCHFAVESAASVAIRMREVIDTLEAHHDGETIALVSHGDPLQILLTALEGKPLNRHRDRPSLAPASITELTDQR